MLLYFPAFLFSPFPVFLLSPSPAFHPFYLSLMKLLPKMYFPLSYFLPCFPLPASGFPLPASRFFLPASCFLLPASRFPLPTFHFHPSCLCFYTSYFHASDFLLPTFYLPHIFSTFNCNSYHQRRSNCINNLEKNTTMN